MTLATLLLCFALTLPNSLQDAPAAPRPSAPALPVARPGEYEVASLLETWRDEVRKRDVPVKLWRPVGDGPFPVIVFSHGLGGTREGYSFAGRHWASHGYVSVHVQHLGSDDSVWRGAANPMRAMQRAALDLDNLTGRPADISFAIDELTRRAASAGWELAGQLNLDAIGVAGHSFGAYTALCVAGRKLVAPLGAPRTFGDPRVKCALAMSAPASERDARNGCYSDVRIPCFHMTGTKDESSIGDTSAADRRIPYDASVNAERYLLVLASAEHSAFADPRLGTAQRDSANYPLILASSTAFFDAYLRADAKALDWLREGGFVEQLGDHGTFEHAQASPASVEAR